MREGQMNTQEQSPKEALNQQTSAAQEQEKKVSVGMPYAGCESETQPVAQQPRRTVYHNITP